MKTLLDSVVSAAAEEAITKDRARLAELSKLRTVVTGSVLRFEKCVFTDHRMVQQSTEGRNQVRCVSRNFHNPLIRV